MLCNATLKSCCSCRYRVLLLVTADRAAVASQVLVARMQLKPCAETVLPVPLRLLLAGLWLAVKSTTGVPFAVWADQSRQA